MKRTQVGGVRVEQEGVWLPIILCTQNSKLSFPEFILNRVQVPACRIWPDFSFFFLERVCEGSQSSSSS